jgi:hypothetical protein
MSKKIDVSGIDVKENVKAGRMHLFDAEAGATPLKKSEHGYPVILPPGPFFFSFLGMCCSASVGTSNSVSFNIDYGKYV